MIRRVLAAAALIGGTTACDPCAGTPICSLTPRISYGGQFIDHKTGAPVGNVVVQFIRKAGIPIDDDTIEARSWESGYFQLKGRSAYHGVTAGELWVYPPAPYKPYVVHDVNLSTSKNRAEGFSLGRLVVNPYVLLLGAVTDRVTGAAVPGAQVTMTQTGGVPVLQAPLVVNADDNGRIFIEPPVAAFGAFALQFEVLSSQYPRAYKSTTQFQTSYRDGELLFVSLRLGAGIQYFGKIYRRGTGEVLPGVTVEFRRRAGIAIDPDTIATVPDAAGHFSLTPTPLADGAVVGDLVIRPPSPFPAETIPDVRLETWDDNQLRKIGEFGYGPQFYLYAQLYYRSTGKVVSGGELAVIRQTGGQPPVLPVGQPVGADTGVRQIQKTGVMVFGGATADTGEMRFDAEVRLDPPNVPEFIRNLVVPAKYDSMPHYVGAFRVGMWHPSVGEVRDAATELPVGGAQVQFVRTAGARVAGAVYDTVSAASGVFPLHVIPVDSGVVTGTLTITTGGIYRDTTIAGIQLRTTQNDTLRSVGIIRLTKAP